VTPYNFLLCRQGEEGHGVL